MRSQEDRNIFNKGESPFLLKRLFLGIFQKIEMLFFGLGESNYTPTQTFDTMPSANYKTTICRHWQAGHCDKTAELCDYAHGFKELRRHCHHGFNCFKGLQCEYPHHPKEIEYFTLKAQVKPKVVRDMGTQTDFPEPMPVIPPPAGFTDDDTTSGEEADPEKEKYNVRKRRATAAYNIRQGIKTLADYDQITWRVKKKNVRTEVEAAKALVARNVRKSRAKQLIAAGQMKREDFDKNYYQKQKRKLKVVE